MLCLVYFENFNAQFLRFFCFCYFVFTVRYVWDGSLADVALAFICASINLLKAAMVGVSNSLIFSFSLVSLQPLQMTRHIASCSAMPAISE